MANKPLKSIKYPGLSDTYTFLQNDPTLTQSGQAADAKVVGDKIEKKVSKPTSAPNGTAGQLLRTNGDGTTQWVDQGLPTDEQTAEAINEWLADHPEATTTVQDGAITEAKLSDNLHVIEYNILDYAGNSLNEKWDNMKRNFVTWQNKQIIIPYPRENDSACIKVGNDWKWKILAPIVFDDSCNCANIEIHGELYVVAPVEQVLLFDDEAKPENIYFTNGIEIRGNRQDGNTVGCAIEIRSGARINFLGQTIINDCGYGVVVGGANQTAPSEAYFDRVQIGFFNTNAIYVYGGTYPANIYAEHIETACAQNADLDCIVLSNNVSNSKIGFVAYGTDIAKDGYTTYDANSVIKCNSVNKDTHNIVVDFIYATTSNYGAYLNRGNSGGSLYDVHLGEIGVGSPNKTAIYARYCFGLTVNNIKRDNLFDVEGCYFSRIGKQDLKTADNFDRFAGINTVVNIDTSTGVNVVPPIANKEIGAITIVKTANGKRAYINDGDENLQIDGQMFVPAVASLPIPNWQLRGKMYRVNNDSGQDIIAVCIRYNGNSYKWFDLISNTVL